MCWFLPLDLRQPSLPVLSRLTEVSSCLTEVDPEWPSVSLNLHSGRAAPIAVSLKLTPTAVPALRCRRRSHVQDRRDLPNCYGPLGTERVAQRSQGAGVHAAGGGGLGVVEGGQVAGDRPGQSRAGRLGPYAVHGRHQTLSPTIAEKLWSAWRLPGEPGRARRHWTPRRRAGQALF